MPYLALFVLAITKLSLLASPDTVVKRVKARVGSPVRALAPNGIAFTTPTFGTYGADNAAIVLPAFAVICAGAVLIGVLIAAYTARLSIRMRG